MTTITNAPSFTKASTPKLHRLYYFKSFKDKIKTRNKSEVNTNPQVFSQEKRFKFNFTDM